MMRTAWSIAMLGMAASALAQAPAESFDRGAGLQAWQDPGIGAVLARCRGEVAPFRLGAGSAAPGDPPPVPTLPVAAAIPGVVADGAAWRIAWAWEGNNADGPIADGAAILFANNDAGNVMRLDPASGLATIVHGDTNTSGAVSRSKNGALFVAERGLGGGIWQLEPERRQLAYEFDGEPFECVGGVINDLSADARGGVYFSVSGRGVFYAAPDGVIREFGTDVAGANGIILSADEQRLYLTNGPEVVVFDVAADGGLERQRLFARLRSGSGGDGSAIDSDGRLYVATGTAVDVFAASGAYLGTIPGPAGLHGVAIGGEDKRWLYAIVFYGEWGTINARNLVIEMPLLSRGYLGRAK